MVVVRSKTETPSPSQQYPETVFVRVSLAQLVRQTHSRSSKKPQRMICVPACPAERGNHAPSDPSSSTSNTGWGPTLAGFRLLGHLLDCLGHPQCLRRGLGSLRSSGAPPPGFQVGFPEAFPRYDLRVAALEEEELAADHSSRVAAPLLLPARSALRDFVDTPSRCDPAPCSVDTSYTELHPSFPSSHSWWPFAAIRPVCASA